MRFVGDPAARIAEDYLRILRFFRIHAWYGDPAGGLDPDGLAACAAPQDGLARLSRERVGAEIAKLLAAADPAPAVAAMAATGILAARPPRRRPARRSRPLVPLEAAAGAAPRWQRRLAALGWRPDWAEALRLSRADARALEATAAALAAGDPPAAAAYRHGADAARDAALVRAARARRRRAARPRGRARPRRRRRFPLAAADLGLEGPALGRALKRLEAAWLASDFTLDAAALLAARREMTRGYPTSRGRVPAGSSGSGMNSASSPGGRWKRPCAQSPAPPGLLGRLDQVAELHGLGERAGAVLVRDVGLRAALEQLGDELEVDLVDGPVQRRRAVALSRVDVGARCVERDRARLALAVLDQCRERALRARGSAASSSVQMSVSVSYDIVRQRVVVPPETFVRVVDELGRVGPGAPHAFHDAGREHVFVGLALADAVENAVEDSCTSRTRPAGRAADRLAVPARNASAHP